MSKKTYYIERFLAIIAALILLQTLYYKFTGHPDSVYIFTTLGLEPQGRIILGVVELIVALLLLFSRTALLAAILGTIIMLGAIMSHLFVLGLEVRDDNGTLIIMAIVVFACCLYVLFSRSDQFYDTYKKWTGGS